MSRFAILKFAYKIAKRVFPNLVWHIPNSDAVYLTFDDGPHPEITPWVLDQLDAANAKATFFVVGENVQRYPEVIELIKEKGHSIGNHTQRHVSGWAVSTEEYNQDILECENHLGGTTMFRPPYGKLNFKSLPFLKNHRIIMWDVLTKDYWPNVNQSIAIKRIKRITEGGSIVLFHDSEKAEDNLKVLLPQLLEHLSIGKIPMRKL